MTTVATRYHFIYSGSNDTPKYACKGKCRSVWWEDDILTDSALHALKCPKCHGHLELAQAVDYQVIETPKNMQEYINMHEYKFKNFAVVKPEFIKLAKNGWC